MELKFQVEGEISIRIENFISPITSIIGEAVERRNEERILKNILDKIPEKFLLNADHILERVVSDELTMHCRTLEKIYKKEWKLLRSLNLEPRRKKGENTLLQLMEQNNKMAEGQPESRKKIQKLYGEIHKRYEKNNQRQEKEAREPILDVACILIKSRRQKKKHQKNRKSTEG